jgi:cytochrome c
LVAVPAEEVLSPLCGDLTGSRATQSRCDRLRACLMRRARDYLLWEKSMKAPWICISAAALTLVGAGHALADEALARKSGCLECHSVDKKVIGPAYRDVAAKYKGDARARSALIEKVKKGGKGNWTEVTGGVLMPPFSPRLSDAEIQRLVDWVLSR